MKKYVVNEENTLKNFTDNTYAQASFCFRTLLKDREIRVNGIKVSSDCALKVGDEVCYFLTKAQAEKRAFLPVFEDENVIIIDKESGVNSEAVFSQLQERGACYFLHRLDRNTAGLMLFAKTKDAEKTLLEAFRERKIHKVYHALVVGKMPRKHEKLEAYLQKNEKISLVSVSEKQRGERIITEYEVMEEREDCSLLKVTIHTGKTHQIRAHFSYLRHPVVGDEKYGDGAYNRAHNATRQRLIAKELTFSLDGALRYLNGKTFFSEREL